MNLTNEIEAEWRRYRLALVGAACILFWWVVWLGQAGSSEASNEICRWLGWIAGGVALVMEIILAYTKAVTITHWIAYQFRRLADIGILAGFFAFSVFWIDRYWTGGVHHHTIYQGMLLWLLAGHFFLRGDD